MQDQVAQICELRYSARSMSPTEYWGAYGAGGGANLGTSAPLLMPKIDFITNDAWPLIRGTANQGGAPVLLMDRYGKGILYVLTIPDNFNDFYSLPQGVLTALRSYLGADLPVQMNGPSQVSLMEYNNGTFVVQSFRDAPVSVTVSVDGAGKQLQNLVTNEVVNAGTATPADAATGDRRPVPAASPKSRFTLTVLPHGYAAFVEAAFLIPAVSPGSIPPISSSPIKEKVR